MFAGKATKFHLFGLKSQGMQHAAKQSHVANCDSQAYGIAARHEAGRRRISKTDQFLARTMRDWYARQIRMATALPPPQQLHTSAIAEVEPPLGTHELRVNAAYDELRTLHEAGEIDWSNLSPQTAYEFAYLDD